VRIRLGWALATLTVLLLTGCASAEAAPSGRPYPSRIGTTSAIPTFAVPTSATPTSALPTSVSPTSVTRTPARATSSTTVRATPQQPIAQRLPLEFPTGSATQVVTVVATDSQATTATLQMWNKAPGGWIPAAPPVTAEVGRSGLSAYVSEGAKATPIGSFALTQAFGRDSDPGTALPYFQTTPDDWWISEPGPLYNTHQNCSSDCAFDTGTGNPNEHLYYEIPYYDYAVVIDYNTANAGPVVPGAGSAFFLHVTTGKPTLGCVAIPTSALLPLMRWLDPARHPRILIGTA
jgi:L,D-peptidoglycan transpeptidase YkuD (ErfK/YbiS/YcfS/YnhG family)